MRDHRTLRFVSVLTITAALTFSVFASTALAALPNVIVGGGTSSACITGTTSGATPTAVSPGKVAGFKIWAKNCDSSTLSKFFLTAPGSNAYAATWFNDGNPNAMSSCDTTGGVLKCTFGQVAPGQTIYVTVGITTTSGPTESVGFEWSTSGFVLGKNKSHGDRFEWMDQVSLNGSADFAGQFAFDSTLALITNGSAGINNKQQTAVDASGIVSQLGQGIPLTVQDGDSTSNFCLTPATCPTTFFGEWSTVNVDNGTTFGTAFKLTISIYKGPSPNQVNGIYHTWTDAAVSGVTGVAATDTITSAAHGLANGATIKFTALAGGAGLTPGTLYYVRDVTANTFKVALTPGGTAVDFTTDISAATYTGVHEEDITDTFPAGGSPTTIPSFSAEKVGQNLVLVIYSYHNGPFRGH